MEIDSWWSQFVIANRAGDECTDALFSTGHGVLQLVKGFLVSLITGSLSE